MAIKPQIQPANEAALFARVWDGHGRGFSPTLARHILKLGFSPEDQARMHELAEKNREDSLTTAEQEELDSYIKVGDQIAILQSRARRSLKKRQSPRNGHA